MSMNLMFANEANPDRAAHHWAAITTIAPNHGMITLDENIVNDIARLLDGQELTGGERVRTYSYEDDDDYAAMVCAFGPSLLPVQIQDQVRDRLANDANGKAAVRLFNEILRLELQISLAGKEHCDAHLKGVNWPADDVEINRCSGNMYGMLRSLGFAHNIAKGDESGSGEVDFAEFAEAVRCNAFRTDMPERLERFVACARRNGATKVYWA